MYPRRILKTAGKGSALVKALFASSKTGKISPWRIAQLATGMGLLGYGGSLSYKGSTPDIPANVTLTNIEKEAEFEFINKIKDSITPSGTTIAGALLGVGALGAVVGGANSRKLVKSMRGAAQESLGAVAASRTPQAIRAAHIAKSRKILNKTNQKLLKTLGKPGQYLTRTQYSLLKKQGLI